MSSLGTNMRGSVHEQLEKARRLEVVSLARFLQDIQEWLAFAIHYYNFITYCKMVSLVLILLLSKAEYRKPNHDVTSTFRGSVVKDFANFWVDIVADISQPNKK
uniref:Uncharacterized protein n=1 Tax=Timema poppense TaxID=170557 RepID=A0A7R9CLR1_TIMPO|nr:unnamed protein product [Timema poppensis]